MIDMSLTSEQTIKLLTVLDSEWQHLLMRGCDDIFYGSIQSARKAGARERAFKAVRESLPESIWQRWDAHKRIERAQRLRERADKIEAGDD